MKRKQTLLSLMLTFVLAIGMLSGCGSSNAPADTTQALDET